MDYLTIAYSCRKKGGGGIFREGGVDFGRSHRCLKGGVILGGGGVSAAHSCEKRGKVDSRNVALYKRRVYSGREG